MAEGGDKRKISEAPPSYSDSIKNIGEQAPKLVSIVQDSIKQVTESLEKVKKLIGESVDVSSPEVSMRLEELRTFLGDVVLKGRSYCKGCKDLGEYASDQDLIGEICTDLDNGNLTELKDFLVEIDEHLKVMPKHKSYVIIYEPNVHDCVHVIKFEECMFIYYHNFFCISYMTLIGMHELNAPQCN